MNIQKDYNLLKLNTFGINVNAKFFAEISNENDLLELLKTKEFKENKRIFLGGGSNVLFTKDFDGIVILNKTNGIEISENTKEPDEVLVRSMGGELWRDFVNFIVDQNLWGVENLAFIPGTVGAAPMQNIGAYGAELKDALFNVEAYSLEGEVGNKKIFTKDECELGYRESIFKNKLKDKYFIYAVTFKLNKKSKTNITYKILKDYLEINQIEVSKPKDISDAVTAIRKSKLPDPKVIGNAGSFFKNVFVSMEKLNELKNIYPDIPSFEEDETSPNLTPDPSPERRGGRVKIPAGWLIEQCGWKGKRVGNVGVHDKQALVLVNHGGASGEEILNLSKQIISSVKEKFDLDLMPEVNLI